jgi:hypothetical protein
MGALLNKDEIAHFAGVPANDDCNNYKGFNEDKNW